MDNQPAFDRSILIPIFLSGFSVIGIVVVLLIGRSLSTPPEVPTTPSATRFAYVYLGTEPAITTPLVEETEILLTEEPIFEEPTEEQITTPPVQATLTRPGPSTPIILPSATGNLQRTITPATPTVTSASLPPLSPGTYDDGHQYLVYDGWEPTGALHVSFQPGSTISFRFIGRQLRLLYQGGATLGQVRIQIDGGTPVTLDQSSGTEWASDLVSNSTHTVLINHSGGGSVNLDQVIIPDIANTPTPTLTPTRTLTPNQ